MQPLPYTRPLIKISGEALMGGGRHGIDADTLTEIAMDIADVAKRGARVAVVVGGGNIFRGMSGAAHGIGRVKADYMGMLATVMNGLALEQALKRVGQGVSLYSGLPVPTVCRTFSHDDAAADLERGTVVVLAGGTGNPFFTTDTTAALRAAELGCDAILKATQVDGILLRGSQGQSSRRALRQAQFFGGARPRPESDGRRRYRACPRQCNPNRGVLSASERRYWKSNAR